MFFFCFERSDFFSFQVRPKKGMFFFCFQRSDFFSFQIRPKKRIFFFCFHRSDFSFLSGRHQRKEGDANERCQMRRTERCSHCMQPAASVDRGAANTGYSVLFPVPTDPHPTVSYFRTFYFSILVFL